MEFSVQRPFAQLLFALQDQHKALVSEADIQSVQAISLKSLEQHYSYESVR